MRAGVIGDGFSRGGHHFAADIDGVDLAEQFGERARQTAGPAADFEHPHVARVLALADVLHVGKDVLGDLLLTGGEKGFVGPVGAAGVDVMARVFFRALIPIPAHFFELLLARESFH